MKKYLIFLVLANHSHRIHHLIVQESIDNKFFHPVILSLELTIEGLSQLFSCLLATIHIIQRVTEFIGDVVMAYEVRMPPSLHSHNCLHILCALSNNKFIFLLEFGQTKGG